jgi:hypothetical protein
MPKRVVQRTQTGVRIESSLLKVLKGLAEYANLSLHSFEGKAPFSAETQQVIDKLKSVYGCTLTADDSHKLKEESR